MIFYFLERLSIELPGELPGISLEEVDARVLTSGSTLSAKR